MRTIDVANVQQALPEGCRLLLGHGRKRETRNGPAYVLPTPLTTVYRQPCQRVLFWADRDANPFFHFMEALWILAGRRDVEWIQQFNSNIGNYSDDGKVFNGAYGHRWRIHFGADQLAEVVRNLRVNPLCRRQVLTMWGVSDLMKQDTKDVPCNTQVYVQLNTENRLDVMVTNRSNDLIWGAYGANAVQFSTLLEVLAGLIGVPVGNYYQVSMNTHLYETHRNLAERLATFAPDVLCGGRAEDNDPYALGLVSPFPIVTNSKWFHDCELFVEGVTRGFTNSFFDEVALPMMDAWRIFKQLTGAERCARAIEAMKRCAATDWRRACVEWLQRRM